MLWRVPVRAMEAHSDVLVIISPILTLDQVLYSKAKEIFDLSFENIAFGSILFQIDGFISPALQNVCMLVFRRLLTNVLTMFFLSCCRYYRLNVCLYSLFMKYSTFKQSRKRKRQSLGNLVESQIKKKT